VARLDLYTNGENGFYLDVQTDILSGLNTRLVVPLMPPDIAPIPGRRLNPTFMIDGEPFVMVTQFMGAIPERALGRPVGSLDDSHDAVVMAIDMIFLGF